MHMHAPGTRYASRQVRFFTSPCNLMHNVSALCHASLVCLCPWCSGGTQRNTVSVHHNASRLIVARQDDWRRMRGRYNPVCGTSRLDLMSPGPFDIQRSPSAPDTSHLSPCPLTSLSPVFATPADTYLIGWLHVWTRQKLIALVGTLWHVFDWATLYSFAAIPLMIGWHFASPRRGDSLWLFSVFTLCVRTVSSDDRWKITSLTV